MRSKTFETIIHNYSHLSFYGSRNREIYSKSVKTLIILMYLKIQMIKKCLMQTITLNNKEAILNSAEVDTTH